MNLACELRKGKYMLFLVEGQRRWPILPLGHPAEAAFGGFTRPAALEAALLAGFSIGEAKRAVRGAEDRTGSS